MAFILTGCHLGQKAIVVIMGDDTSDHLYSHALKASLDLYVRSIPVSMNKLGGGIKKIKDPTLSKSYDHNQCTHKSEQIWLQHGMVSLAMSF